VVATVATASPTTARFSAVMGACSATTRVRDRSIGAQGRTEAVSCIRDGSPGGGCGTRHGRGCGLRRRCACCQRGRGCCEEPRKLPTSQIRAGLLGVGCRDLAPPPVGRQRSRPEPLAQSAIGHASAELCGVGAWQPRRKAIGARREGLHDLPGGVAAAREWRCSAVRPLRIRDARSGLIGRWGERQARPDVRSCSLCGAVAVGSNYFVRRFRCASAEAILTPAKDGAGSAPELAFVKVVWQVGRRPLAWQEWRYGRRLDHARRREGLCLRGHPAEDEDPAHTKQRDDLLRVDRRPAARSRTSPHHRSL
jgi:hypothetical protein